MDHLSLAPKFSNLLIISISFCLLLLSQLFNLTLSLYDPYPLPDGIIDASEYTSIHPNDRKVLIRIQQQLGNNSQLWASNENCCWWFCSRPDLMACNMNGQITDLTLTFNSPSNSSSILPAALGDLPGLRGLEITGPYFTGPIPRAIRKLHLSSLQIVNTSITGRIPGTVCGMVYLDSLEITNNKYITGSIPKALAKLTNLRYLDLSFNRLDGPIPDFLGRMSNLTWLLSLKSNRFSGPIPTSLGQIVGLYKLDLSQNQLSSTVPASLGDIVVLRNLNLSHNHLSGSVPTSLGHIVNMASLDLSHNQLSGSVPASLGNIVNLENLDLSHNQLSGLIPETFSSFNRLWLLPYSSPITLFLNNNRLTGSIPRAIARASIWKIDVSSNKLTDASYLFQTNNFFNATIINLSNNRLKFNFSKARFNENLHSLNISHNLIYGSIPKQLGTFTFLNSIDVSYNRLCGQIPSGVMLKRFNPIYFSHNACLCGAPLSPCTNKNGFHL